LVKDEILSVPEIVKVETLSRFSDSEATPLLFALNTSNFVIEGFE
jgi:hypothetical protein